MRRRKGKENRKVFFASNQYYLVFVQILIFEKEKESTKMESGGKGTNKQNHQKPVIKRWEQQHSKSTYTSIEEKSGSMDKAKGKSRSWHGWASDAYISGLRKTSECRRDRRGRGEASKGLQMAS